MIGLSHWLRQQMFDDMATLSGRALVCGAKTMVVIAPHPNRSIQFGDVSVWPSISAAK